MEIAIITGLILLNGILSMSEIAFVSARKSKLETESKRGNASAKTALKLSNDPDRFLSTVQIGITLISIMTGLFSGEAFAADFAAVIAQVDYLAPYAMSIAKVLIIITVTYLTLVFGELVPKRLGMCRAETVAKIIANPMDMLSRVASPIVWVLSKSTHALVRLLRIENNEDGKITEEEIKAIVKEGVDGGEVQKVEHEIVERVFSLGDRNVESIMTHRSDLIWLNTDEDRMQVKQKIMDHMHNVYPVAKGNADNFIGVALLKDLFGNIDSPDFVLDRFVSLGYFLPENQSVYTALERFRQNNVKYGFVINEFGEIEGLVTLDDILDALVGHMENIEEEREITVRTDGSLLVDGQCSFYDFLKFINMEYLYADHNYNTLSGLLLEKLHHIPVAGEVVEWQTLHMEIVDMDGARIDKVLVTHGQPLQAEKEEHGAK